MMPRSSPRRHLESLALMIASSGCGLTTKPAPPAGPREDVEYRPRWLAFANDGALSLLRFDDPRSPTLRALLEQADQTVDERRVVWSQGGRSLAFVTRDAIGEHVFFARLEDDFAPREIAVDPSASHRPAWIGDDALVLEAVLEAGTASERAELHRVPVDEPVPEALGTYRSGAADNERASDQRILSASANGAFYSIGEPEDGTLMLVRATGEPEQVGRAMPRTWTEALPSSSSNDAPAELTWAGDVTWSADGSFAVYWTWIERCQVDGSASGTFAAPVGARLELEAGDAPGVAAISVPPALAITSAPIDPNEPLGNRITSCAYDTLGWRVGAPSGQGVGYVVNRTTTDGTVSSQTLVFERGSGTPAGSVSGSFASALPAFGFAGPSALFYAEPSSAPSESWSGRLVVHRDGTESVEVGLLGAVPDAAGALGERYLYAVASEALGLSRELLVVDLDADAPSTRRVPLAGSILLESVVPRGFVGARIPYEPHRDTVLGGPDAAATPEATLLVATTTESDPLCTSVLDCANAKYVVRLEDGGVAKKLDDALLGVGVAWSADGNGLLTNGADGVSFVPGPSYEKAYELTGVPWVRLYQPPRVPGP